MLVTSIQHPMLDQHNQHGMLDQHQNTTYAGIAGITSIPHAGFAGDQPCWSMLVFLAGEEAVASSSTTQ